MALRPPKLRTLQMVIPVGQTQVHAGWSITCITIELYDDGFKAVFHIYHAERRPGTPMLKLDIHDDHANRYHPWIGGGSSQATTAYEWRMTYNCKPPLAQAACELRLEIPETQLMKPDEGQRRLVVDEEHPGPWTFRVELPMKQE